MAAERFESCTFKGTYITLTFLNVVTFVAGNVYSFNETEGCYKYVEYDDEATAEVEDVTIENDYACNSCAICDVDPQPAPEPPKPKTGRTVTPGYSVPNCKR